MVSNKPQSKHSERNRNNTSQYIEEFYKYSNNSNLLFKFELRIKIENKYSLKLIKLYKRIEFFSF